MRWSVGVALFAGLIAMAYLIWMIGVNTVFQSVALAGFGGLALLCLYALLPLILLGAAWSSLLPVAQGARLDHFCVARAVRDSIADLSPFSAVGGTAAAAHVMILHRVLPAYAVTSVAVDATTEAMAQVVFFALGVALGFTQLQHVAAEAWPDDSIAAVLVLAIPGITLLILLQKRGGSVVRRVARQLFPKIEIDPSFRGAIYELYASHGRLALSAALHLAAWLTAGIDTYIAFRLMGGRISLSDAIALEALLCMVRSLAAFVPAAVGIQEAGYTVLAAMFGLPAEMGLAVSILKRAREIVIGVPALLYWQALEGKTVYIGWF